MLSVNSNSLICLLLGLARLLLGANLSMVLVIIVVRLLLLLKLHLLMQLHLLVMDLLRLGVVVLPLRLRLLRLHGALVRVLLGLLWLVAATRMMLLLLRLQIRRGSSNEYTAIHLLLQSKLIYKTVISLFNKKNYTALLYNSQ